MPDNENSSPHQEIHVLEIVGCFLVFFAILLLIALATEETVSAKVTNLVSSLILLTIGVGMFLRGVVVHRHGWVLPVVLFAVLAVASAVVSFCLSRSMEVRGAREKAIVSESAAPENEKSVKSESGEIELKKTRSFFVEALRRIGWPLRKVVESISLRWLKIFTAVGFGVIAAAVWLVRRETVLDGVTDRKWWRDLRLWTALIMATQVVIYLLLGT